MAKPIYEPFIEGRVAQTQFQVKDARQKVDATRWWEPECSAGTDCDGDEPPLENSFAQPTGASDLEKWAFRLTHDGSLQTKGVLDVSGATSGTIAVTLPGPSDPLDEPNFIPFSNPLAPTHQAITLRVTTTGDDTGLTNAVGFIDSATGEMAVSWIFAVLPLYHIKVFSDSMVVTAGDGAFIWAVPEDVGGLNLIDVEIDVTTVSSSGIVQVQIHNITQGADMLSTRAQIDTSEFHSKDSATQPVVDAGNDDVAHGDRIRIDVDAAGTGAAGLGVVLRFGP